jgi:parvulin-like peptidyl-prolyl isomerase
MTRFTRPFLLIIIAATTLMLTGCTKTDDSVESQTAIITVGKRVITLEEYDETLSRHIAGELEGANDEELSAIKKAVVAQLIDEALILDAAIQLGLTVSEKELAAEVLSIREASGDDDFDSMVTERYGTMEKWKDEIRRKVMIKKCIETVIGPKIGVTEDIARQYYDSHLKEYTIPRQVRARMILVATEERARNIRKSLTVKDFAEVAKEVSLSPESSLGGDLGYFGRGEMPKEFEDVVFKLQVGKISRVIKTGYGYHIFLVEARRRGGRLKFAEVKEQIATRLRMERGEVEFNDWIRLLKEEKRIEIKDKLL